LKSRGERDLADAQIWVAQEITRICESSPRNILHEICAGYLLEIFTQVIGIDTNDLRDFGQGKLFVCVFFDVLARFPNRDRLSSTLRSRVFKFSNR